jgi:hypothetical protein
MIEMSVESTAVTISPLSKLSISHIFLNIKFDKKRKVCKMAQGGSMGGLI